MNNTNLLTTDTRVPLETVAADTHNVMMESLLQNSLKTMFLIIQQLQTFKQHLDIETHVKDKPLQLKDIVEKNLSAVGFAFHELDAINLRLHQEKAVYLLSTKLLTSENHTKILSRTRSISSLQVFKQQNLLHLRNLLTTTPSMKEDYIRIMEFAREGLMPYFETTTISTISDLARLCLTDKECNDFDTADFLVQLGLSNTVIFDYPITYLFVHLCLSRNTLDLTVILNNMTAYYLQDKKKIPARYLLVNGIVSADLLVRSKDSLLIKTD